MNLMFYAFNNPAVITEEQSTRNVLRSQTTDRGPSRKLRSRGKLNLASNQVKKRSEIESEKANPKTYGIGSPNEFAIPPHIII